MPHPVYEMLGMQDFPIEDQFYNYELVKVTVSHYTDLEIQKTLRNRKKGGIKQNLVKLTGYNAIFNTWVKVTDIKKIKLIIFT